MSRNLLLFGLTIFLISSAACAQRVKWRDGLLSLDGKPYLSYEVLRTRGVKIYTYHALGEESTLFQAHICSNWTFKGGDSYRHYYFPETNLELILPSKRKYNFQWLLPRMVEEGVLDEEGNMDQEALRKFVPRYHVPLPPRFGRKVHRLPVVGSNRKDSHRSRISTEPSPKDKSKRERSR